MPTYGYQCTQCQHEFQVFQAMKDDPITVCPECGGKTKRLLYPVGIVFKGTGWYINDSRKPDKSETGEAKPSEATEGARTDGTKTDGARTDSGGSESKPVGAPDSGATETKSTPESKPATEAKA